MDEFDYALLIPLGYAVQWLRGFPKFNDGWALLSTLAAAAAIVLVNHQVVGAREFVQEVVQKWEPVMAGLGLAMLGSHVKVGSVSLAPKYNAYEKKGDSDAKVSVP